MRAFPHAGSSKRAAFAPHVSTTTGRAAVEADERQVSRVSSLRLRRCACAAAAIHAHFTPTPIVRATARQRRRDRRLTVRNHASRVVRTGRRPRNLIRINDARHFPRMQTRALYSTPSAPPISPARRIRFDMPANA
jgi:hypothetical protein